MKSAKPINPFSPIEIQKFILPVSLSAILILAGMVVDVITSPLPATTPLVFLGVSGILYIALCNHLVARFNSIKISYGIINSLLTGIGLGILSLLLPKALAEVNHILVIFGAIAIGTTSGRRFTHLYLAGILSISLPQNIPALINSEEVLEYFMPIIVSMVVLEVVIRLKDSANQHIHRLETINKVSRQIMQSLDTKQTLSLLDKTIQETLSADTYFIGIRENDLINLELFYDDGDYFNGTYVPISGTLSGWVLNNQKELFLPDMRDEVQLEGVEHFVIGREKTSLSWIGVPLSTENISGVLALASYKANAFDRADLELLINLGQHVTLALDNTVRHAQVEKQARRDSLTGVLNHGFFLNGLTEQAEQSKKANTKLSLIMLDIDYFKQYNDTYGHLVGDRVLKGLCSIIQQHIKHTDLVGRWGGEEFVISLPGADGNQAYQIARRISETLRDLRVYDQDQQIIPVPTISQGIAVHPEDANEIYRLIDAADKRLYVAKERGRDQIEPKSAVWGK